MVLRPASGLERAVDVLRGFKEGGLHESLGVWMCEGRFRDNKVCENGERQFSNDAGHVVTFLVAWSQPMTFA
jgi:hypothetical protein